MALNWTYRAFFRELAHARGPTSEVFVLLSFIVRVVSPQTIAFNGFGVIQPLVSMVFNGQGPLVQQCDGFDGSLTSICVK